MGARPVYIADGHHRYTMALQYQKEIAQAHGGPLPPAHPANFCMFVLVGMQDDGLLILPTHRLISGLKTFDIEVMRKVLAPVANVTDVNIAEDQLPHYIDNTLPKQPAATFGLFDGRTRKTHQITFIDPDVLKSVDPAHSPAWRQLDVAIVQRYLLDEVLKPKFAGGADPGRGYTADSNAVDRDDRWQEIPDRPAAQGHAPARTGRTGQDQRSHAAEEHIFLSEAGDGDGNEPVVLKREAGRIPSRSPRFPVFFPLPPITPYNPPLCSESICRNAFFCISLTTA